MSGTPAGRWPEIRRRVGELAELPLEQRERRLAELAPEVAAEVRALLATDDPALSGRLEAAVGRSALDWLDQLSGTVAEPADLAGSVVGSWRLERMLGRGGMAEVWEASRADGAYDQRVAVKLLKRGMDTDELVVRFRRERQILARLEHPSIARLLDGGVAPDGRLFLVLEKVDGEPIIAWAERRGLDLGARLRLLVEVCQVVAAAHRQLVVHRDLKPSNILVTEEGRVKLLDFGIAKLLDDDGDDSAAATRTEVRVLTPAYAAPEQILGRPVSTATDVYALGVLGYELVTGELPHRRARRGLEELESAVETESVARPSRALADAVEPDRRQRARAVRGDLDTVLLRSLEREPERRYESVGDLADDLLAFLERRPIKARPDSTVYRLRRFVARHRLAVAASTVALLALVAALAAALVQAGRAREQAGRAERQAARAERVRSYLVSVFAVSDPVRARGETVTARALLDEGVRRVDEELAAEPGLHGEMLDLLADLYRKLGELATARELAGRALELRTRTHGAESIEAATSELTLGWALARQGEFAAARPHLEHAIAVFERIGGADSLAAAEAREPLMELVFASEGPAATLPIVERRLATYRHVFDRPDERLGRALSDLGVVLHELERPAEAEAALAESLAILEASTPADDPRRALPHNNLAAVLLETARVEEGLAHVERAVELRTRAYGAQHPETRQSLGLRVQALRRLGRLEEAEREARELLARAEGVDRFGATEARALLGQILLDRARPGEALAAFEAAIAERRDLLAPDHPLVYSVRLQRAAALAALGATERARAELDRLLAELDGREGLAEQRERVRALRESLIR